MTCCARNRYAMTQVPTLAEEWQCFFKDKSDEWISSSSNDSHLQQLIHRTMMANQISSIPYPVKLLKPIIGAGFVRSIHRELEFLVLDIFKVLEWNQWKSIEAIQYLFEFRGWTHRYVALYLKEIRASNFIIGFTGNTAGFNVLVIDGLAIRFNEYDPITVWEFRGDNFATGMRNPSREKMVDWGYSLRGSRDWISTAIHSLTPIRNRFVRLYFIQNEWFGLCNISGLSDIILDYAF